MACRSQGTPVFPSTGGDDDYDEAAAATGCGCFRRFCLGRDDDESHSYLLREKEGQQEAWFVAKLRKLKESSEVVAGPKWKNLIRKMGRTLNPNKTAQRFQYSPESYALNFAADDAQLLHSFSTKFAPGFSINHHPAL